MAIDIIKNIDNLLSLTLGSLDELLVLFSTMCWASIALVAKKCLPKLNAGVIVFYRFLIATIVLGFFMLFFPLYFTLSLHSVTHESLPFTAA